MCASAFWTLARILDGYDHLATVITIPCRNTVSPPELAADTPVTDIIGPVEVCLVHTLWKKLDLTVLYTFNCRFDHLIHLYEPLLLNHWLNSCVTSVVYTYIMRMWYDFYKKTFFFEIIH